MGQPIPKTPPSAHACLLLVPLAVDGPLRRSCQTLHLAELSLFQRFLWGAKIKESPWDSQRRDDFEKYNAVTSLTMTQLT